MPPPKKRPKLGEYGDAKGDQEANQRDNDQNNQQEEEGEKSGDRDNRRSDHEDDIPHFDRLLAQHALSSWYKQMRLREVIADRNWNLSLEPSSKTFGKLVFGTSSEDPEGAKYDIQVLGSESLVSQTWLWSWNNPSIPDHLKVLAKELREKTNLQNLPEFATEQWDLLPNRDGHRMGLVACGICDAKAYYSGPNGNVGRVLMLITDPTFPSHRPFSENSSKSENDTQNDESDVMGEAYRILTCVQETLMMGFLSAAPTSMLGCVESFVMSLSDAAGERPKKVAVNTRKDKSSSAMNVETRKGGTTDSGEEINKAESKDEDDAKHEAEEIWEEEHVYDLPDGTQLTLRLDALNRICGMNASTPSKLSKLSKP